MRNKFDQTSRHITVGSSDNNIREGYTTPARKHNLKGIPAVFDDDCDNR